MHFLHHALALVALHTTFTLASPIEAAAQVIPPEYPYGNTLQQGQSLLAGQGLISPNGQYTLVLQEDGNLVEYSYGNWATWATETAGLRIDHATLQLDGNFVLYGQNEQARWASETWLDWSTMQTGWVIGHRLVLDDQGYVTVEQTKGLKTLGGPGWSTWVRKGSSEGPTGPPAEGGEAKI